MHNHVFHVSDQSLELGPDRVCYNLVTKSVFVICEKQRPESGISSVLPIICVHVAPQSY